MKQFPDFPSRRQLLRTLLAGSTLAVMGSGLVLAQDDSPNSSLYSGRGRPLAMLQAGPGPGAGPRPGPGAMDPAPRPPYGNSSQPPPTSWYEYPLPPQKEARVNDIVTIRVDIAQRQNSDGSVQRRLQGKWDAVLDDWIVLTGLRRVKPAPATDGDPRIQYNVNQQNRATGTMATTESVKFEIATTVQAILPNGNLVLEAHRKVRINEELWNVSLSGVCRREDILASNVIISNNVANLSIEKTEAGIIHDGYRRGFITRFLDTFKPF